MEGGRTAQDPALLPDLVVRRRQRDPDGHDGRAEQHFGAVHPSALALVGRPHNRVCGSVLEVEEDVDGMKLALLSREGSSHATRCCRSTVQGTPSDRENCLLISAQNDSKYFESRFIT